MVIMSMKSSTVIVKSIVSWPGIQAQGRCQYGHLVNIRKSFLLPDILYGYGVHGATYLNCKGFRLLGISNMAMVKMYNIVYYLLMYFHSRVR